MAPDLSSLATILAAILGAFIGFVLWQTLGERLRRRRLRLRSFQVLIHEFGQNQQHQALSSMISLEDEAYRQFKRRGFLVELDETMQRDLMRLYSRIHEKNQLLLYHLSAVSAGRSPGQLQVIGGQAPIGLVTLVGQITTEIAQNMGALLPRLEAAFTHARDP